MHASLMQNTSAIISLSHHENGTAVHGQHEFLYDQGYGGGFRAGWTWDGQSLEAASDALGFYPLFYWADGARCMVSTTITAMLDADVPARPDAGGIACALHYGQFLGSRTVIEGIKVLPPNARLTWREGHFHLSGGYRHAKPAVLSRDDAIEGYITLFREAIAKALPTSAPIVVPLTGGRDSRHIIFELMQQKATVQETITAQHFPIRNNEDMAIAKLVSAELSIPHHALETRGSYPDAEARKLPELEWLSLEHVFSLPVLDYLEQKPHVTVFDGLGGDVLSAGLYLSAQRHQLFEQGRLEDLARDFCHTSGIEKLLTSEAKALYGRERAIAAIMEELRQHSQAPNPVSSFVFWNRTRRNVALAPLRLMAARAHQIVTPFTYLPLYDFLASLPPEMMWDHRFHDDAIARAYPQWAHLPYEDKKQPPPTNAALTRACAKYAFKQGWLSQTTIFNRKKLAAALTKCLMLPQFSEAWWFRRALYLTTLPGFLEGYK